jgi:UPF0755 protein
MNVLRGVGWFTIFLIVSAVMASTCIIVPTIFWALSPVSTVNLRVVLIPQGTSAFEIAKLLTAEGIVEDPYRPTILVYMLQWNKKLKSGEYAFRFPMNKIDVWQKIVKGDVVHHFVTVIEGATIFDVAEVLDRSGIAQKENVIKLAKDLSFLQSLGFEGITSLEGYLFPATYDFTKKDNAETTLKRMVREFRRRFKPEWLQEAKRHNLSLHEVVTLASMVEKEAVKDEERPVIAAVFFNRLKIGMPLQSDPTAVYDIENFRGPVLKSHLGRRSPYNTYFIKGLPPGPICNPGLASIKAVLFPAEVKYLYFVSDRRGSHRFSVTYEEHLQAIREIAASTNQPDNKGQN